MDLLPVVVGAGWTSGLSAYGTVLALGVLGRLGVGEVPPTLTRGSVLIAAGIMFAIEFIVDKVPYVDNAWDTVHTVVRPVIAGLVGAEFAGETEALNEAVAAAGTGAVALASHAVKAGLRLAVNVSPEPLSTILVSSLEDLLVGVGSYLVAAHPWVAFGLAAVLLVGGAALVITIRRRIGRFLGRVQARRGWGSRR